MTRGLFHRAKLIALITGLAIAAIACTAPASNAPTATTPADRTATPQASGDAKATATAEAEIVAEMALSGELFLNVDSPAEREMFVTTGSIDISGHTTVDALLSVNDDVLEVDAEGKFNHTVKLEEGPNLIEVVASDADGHQFDEVLLVIYEPA